MHGVMVLAPAGGAGEVARGFMVGLRLCGMPAVGRCRLTPG